MADKKPARPSARQILAEPATPAACAADYAAGAQARVTDAKRRSIRR